MNLRLNFSVLGILSILVVLTLPNGMAYSSSDLSPSIHSFSLAFTTIFAISDLQLAQAIPPPYFAHRMGPGPGHGLGPRLRDGSFEESDEDDEENESQARVEPQITPLNRDECLAKLLCGMSVPVTGGGAPKNGYYSEYAQIVGKFFDAFPLEDEENKSQESLEAYDDYSVEDKRPTRLNSKNKLMETTTKSSAGLQLFDIALIKTAKPYVSKNQTEDDERNDRSLISRIARARKIVQKLGEKLQTVRQCQQISGCPFTFKQLRNKLKSKPSISSNVPLGTPSINYKPVSRPKPLSTEISLGRPQSDESNQPFRDPQKGDDEIEEFFGPPPVMINRPSGFGMNQMTGSNSDRRKKPAISQYQYQPQNDGNQYVPYNPPVRYPSSAGSQRPGSLFPNKKVGYKIPSFVKKHQSGENDEFDDVNKSTGPVTLIGAEHEQQQYQQNTQQAFENQGNNNSNGNGQEQLNEDDSNNEDSEGEGDYDDDAEYEDDDDNDNNNDDSNEDEEEEEDEVSQEAEKDEQDNKKNSQNKKTSSKDTPKEEVTVVKKPKIKGYKKPSFASSSIQIGEEFGVNKPNPNDDEQPDNVWSKFAFATSGGLLKEPSEKNKSKLQEKNDEKLNLSSEKETSKEVKSKEVNEDSDEDEEEDDARSDKRPTKFSYHDDEEFETTKDGYFLSSTNPRARPRPKYRGSTKSKSKSNKKKPAKTVTKKPKEEDKSEEEEERTSGPKKEVLTQIGGRPLFPEPEKESSLPQKTSPLSRFNFNLVRPFQSQSYQTSSKVTPSRYTQTRTGLQSSSSSVAYTKPKYPSSESNSYKKDTTVTKSESYLPAVSFGASNGDKLSTVEYLGTPSSQTQARPSMSFPFGGTFSTLKSLFKRPGSSSKGNQDIPGGNNQPMTPSPFIHRPVGPESNTYKRHSPSPSKGRSDKKKKGNKSAKGKGKKGSRY